jgi:hypothetical protein
MEIAILGVIALFLFLRSQQNASAQLQSPQFGPDQSAGFAGGGGGGAVPSSPDTTYGAAGPNAPTGGNGNVGSWVGLPPSSQNPTQWRGRPPGAPAPSSSTVPAASTPWRGSPVPTPATAVRPTSLPAGITSAQLPGINAVNRPSPPPPPPLAAPMRSTTITNVRLSSTASALVKPLAPTPTLTPAVLHPSAPFITAKPAPAPLRAVAAIRGPAILRR